MRTTVSGPLAEMVPDPVTEYPLIPVGRRAVRGASPQSARPGRRSRFYALPTGEATCTSASAPLRRWPDGRRCSHAVELAGCSPTSELVECESPSTDLAAVARSADLVARIGARPARRRAGAHRRRRRAPTCAGGSAPGAGAGSWCSATTTRCGRSARSPRTRSRSTDGVLRGPGCFDMKAGLVMALHALAGARRRATASRCSSPATRSSARRRSRALIEDEAPGCARGAGARGLGRRRRAQDRAQGRLALRGRVIGRAAHAGLEPERGRQRRPSSSPTRCSRSPRSADAGARHHRHPDLAAAGHHAQHRARRRRVRGRRPRA